AVTVVIGLLLRRREKIVRVVVAHVDRLRALPAYRDHARRRVRCLVIAAVCWGGAACGAGLVAARLQGIDDDDRQIRTRDVMLCLDVSGSMEGVDRQVINTYIQLADHISDDRIGFVMFDSSAVTVFPLT
ncbi:VWA domain-containing protein, partial [Pandoraea nosoerga]|nr:VWA domain-containing protein [Pandoraea nosoerga]